MGNLPTRNGHNMFTMLSLLQKGIRRGDKNLAGYAAMEVFGAYNTVMWNRVMTVACEDCWGILAKEIVALRYTDEKRNKDKKGYSRDTQYVSKAISLLCDAKKSRDACYYACNFVLQTYVTNPGEIPQKFVKMNREQIGRIEDGYFSIKEISGPVGEMKVQKTEVEGKQLSVFDMMEEKVEETDRTISYDESFTMEEKCMIWSAYLRKAIRTLDMELAGYAVFYLRQHSMEHIWKTLYAISADECKGIPTREIVALKMQDRYVNRDKPLEKRDEIYICKSIMIMMYQICGEYENILGHDSMDPFLLLNWENREYVDIRKCYLPGDEVPEWVYDVHTLKGKREGKTDWGMNIVEQAALKPLQLAFFDDGSWQQDMSISIVTAFAQRVSIGT